MRDRAFFPTVAVLGLVLVSMQWASGAWDAEFDGYPDESAQFVTGRMVWEYLHAHPMENPISWAGQYYLRYPKVAMGHWPPGYHIAEALWSLIFGSSRMSAMWLQWFLGLAALTALYQLAAGRLPLAITWGILFFTIATPVFQQGLEQTMSELLCLLCSILFMHGMLRFLVSSDRFSSYLVLASFLAAALAKGTAVCLVPVPVLALLVSGKGFRRHLSRWQIAAGAGILAICLLWFTSTSNVLYWAGVTTSIPWPISSFVGLAGFGFLGLALLGFSREPLAIVAASMIGSTVVVSFAVRAMNEPRHWIMVLPPVLLLSGYAFTRFRRPFSALLLAPAILWFPWFWYRQVPGGYRDLLRQVHLPARMLVSSGRGGEGAWIAEVAIAERYPASFVARASKVLAESTWNGHDYRLLASSPAAALRRLDELAIDLVVIDGPSIHSPPHQALLETAMANSPAWRTCGATLNQAAYCRVKAPQFPRRPLTLDVGGWHLVEKIPSSR